MGFDSADEERRAHYPEQGYNLVEIDMMKPPGEALTKIGHSLRLSEITIPPTTNLTDYVVYDSNGDSYSRDEVSEFPDSDDSEGVTELIDSLQTEDGRTQRIALARLAKAVESVPEQGPGAVPILMSELQGFEIELQAESLSVDHIKRPTTPSSSR